MSTTTTITEALAELKTLSARIQKKRMFVYGILGRQEKFKDPLAADGGSVVAIERERQAIDDMEKRTVRIRSAITEANRETLVKISDLTMSIHDWLSWRRDVAPGRKEFLNNLAGGVLAIRHEAQKKGFAIGTGGTEVKPDDVIINLNESTLAKEIEGMEQILGELDGILSLKNATVTVTIED
jgi:hypothetical protein